MQPIEWPERNILKLVTDRSTVGVLVEGDVDLHKALERIKKQREESTKESSRIESKLGNAEFTAKAPSEVVAEHKQRLQSLRQEQEQLTSSERQLQEMMK